MPPAGYADPITNDEPGFHSDAWNFIRAHLLGAHRARLSHPKIFNFGM
jgi:hypothetical protein